jgi:hypothetical protein
MSAPHRLMVHAHCYQPPREEPWLELVPREPSAAPDHDWNVRITRECYAPLGAAPVLDGHGRVRQVINCWEWLSFNVGPTLVHWLERSAPQVLGRMVSGDRVARARTGHGTAIAAPYHHVILPLASRRDKRTEVRWGVREFRRVFGRDPHGMWLPETAVDEETLTVLAEEGITFTILAPHQVTRPDGFGAPLRWRRDGRELSLVVYDGGLSHQVAFGNLLKDANRFAVEISDRRSEIGAAAGSPITDLRSPISVVAVDGETFGHHHRFGDLGIAALIDRLNRGGPTELVNTGQLVSEHPATVDGELVAPSSWSCSHGIERWRSDCGCRMDPATSQGWRAPLRLGLETLSAQLSAIIARDWPANAGDPDEVLMTAGPEASATVRRLVEVERHRLAMFTSCAWFFDDLARIEPRIVLRHAARALDLIPPDDAALLEMALVSLLAEARARDPADGNGATIWSRDIAAGRLWQLRLAAGLVALHEFEREQPNDLVLTTHEWQFDDGVLNLTDLRTGAATHWRGEVITMGVVASRVHLRPVHGEAGTVVEAIDFPEPIRERLATVAAAFVFDSTLTTEARRALDAGDLEPLAARRAALDGALRHVDSAGLLAGADVQLHGVLDLFSLAGERPSLEERAAVWQRLAASPPSAARSRLADRLELVLPS